MSQYERVPDDIEPDEYSDDPLEPVAGFGEHDDEALEEEWEEDALEGGT
jgi:hypothetical protein